VPKVIGIIYAARCQVIDAKTECCSSLDVIKPPGTVVPGRPYVLPQFFIFFNARFLRSLGRSPRNFDIWPETSLVI